MAAFREWKELGFLPTIGDVGDQDLAWYQAIDMITTAFSKTRETELRKAERLRAKIDARGERP